MLFPLLKDAVLLAALVAAVVTDLRSRRIYDWITLPALGLGLVLAFAQAGLGDGVSSPGLLGAATGAVVGYVPFALLVLFGGMGGGDAKLMAAVGALLGFPAVVGAMVLVTVAGGLQGVFAVLARTRPGRALCALAGMRGAQESDFAKTVPYGLAIAAGTVAFEAWRWTMHMSPATVSG